jgi:hypothetical protein
LVETELAFIPCMEPFNKVKVKVITTNERDKSPRTMILPKEKYQLMGSKQQISSCVNILIQVILLCNTVSHSIYV